MFDEKDESLHDVAFNLCVCWKSAGVSAADKVKCRVRGSSFSVI